MLWFSVTERSINCLQATKIAKAMHHTPSSQALSLGYHDQRGSKALSSLHFLCGVPGKKRGMRDDCYLASGQHDTTDE